MAQRKNTVVLSATAIARLQHLVNAGEFESIDDAATHIILSNVPSTKGSNMPATPTGPVPPVEPLGLPSGPLDLLSLIANS